ncbi:hypothetical protein CDFC105_34153 [Clostridioides difficile]|nr:hypothetical protein CDFC105_34153 [Clostridioides difficile]
MYKRQKVYTPIVKEYMDKKGITDEECLPDFFVTAMNIGYEERINTVSYTHLRAHETPEHLVCRLLLEKKNTKKGVTA